MTKTFLQRFRISRARDRQEASRIVQAMARAVDRAGATHRSRTTSTYDKDLAGFTCIQGEMLRELGYSFSVRRDHGTAASVAHLLDPESRIPDLYDALVLAQGANDDHEEWGEILRRFQFALAA